MTPSAFASTRQIGRLGGIRIGDRVDVLAIVVDPVAVDVLEGRGRINDLVRHRVRRRRAGGDAAQGQDEEQGSDRAEPRRSSFRHSMHYLSPRLK